MVVALDRDEGETCMESITSQKAVLISPMEIRARLDRSFSMEFPETKDAYNYFR